MSSARSQNAGRLHHRNATSHTKAKQQTMNIIKVAGTSRTSAVAGAIAGIFRENNRAVVQAIGPTAVNQAIKALALARSYLMEDGYEVIFIPEFVEVEINDNVRTAIKFTVENRNVIVTSPNEDGDDREQED